MFGFFGPDKVSILTKAKYKRVALENIMSVYLGHANFSKIISDETLVVSYDYNS